MVTIYDVAAAAGVSPMTVSNVINERRHVRPETRARVVQAMDELGYRVNVAARNLRTGHTGTIGLAVPEVDRPYFGHLAAAIIAEAARLDVRVVVEQTGASRRNELDALSFSRNRMYDGLILSTVGLGVADTDALRVDFPVVILGEKLFGAPVDHVAMPNQDGARSATNHLIAQGCRRIAIITGLQAHEADISSLRLAGYRRALEESGIGFDPALVVGIGAFSLRDGARAAETLARSGIAFDGVFCVTDTIALGVLRGFATEGVRVPADVKVIGFDGLEESAYSVPALSTVDPGHRLMAATAVDYVTTRIAQPRARIAPREFVSAFDVVARESTGSGCSAEL